MALALIASEHTVVNLSDGYAGTIDLIAEDDAGERIIIDIKTQHTKGSGKVMPRDEWIYQLAAYGRAYDRGLREWWNVAVPVDVDAEVQVFEYTMDQMAHGERVWDCALDTYYTLNDWS